MDTDSNMITIMLATDIHLGVHEKDGIRADDSFVTFEEILKISKEKEVDCILLGGDLFHDNKPSPQCYHKCLALLRKYCMGNNAIHIECLSDQKTIFKDSSFPKVNYEDPNYNISIPIFSIHGNHDDPSGFGRMSALDILSVSGFVNYFGKWTDLNSVQVYPLMLKKNSTKLAIYGLSHIKDERLFRLMKHDQVEYVRPEKDTDNFFNIMVLHQNRVDRPGTKHIPESLLPNFVDLVFWGHEHDCLVDPQWNLEKEFYVTQPGSPVATSLCEGESLQKHVAILKIKQQEFKLEKIPLKTVRPFVFDSVKLSDWNMKLLGNKPSEKIQEYVDRYIRSKLLEKARDLKTDDPNQPELPLIRLRIEFEQDDECFNAIRFGQTFTGVVANPTEMVIMKRKQSATRHPRKGHLPSDEPEASNLEDINIGMSDLIDQYFQGLSDKSNMKVLSRVWMAEAMTRFIEKDDKEALDDVVYHEMKHSRQFLEKENTDADNVKELIEKCNVMRLDRVKEELEQVRILLDSDSRSERESKGTSGQTATRMDVSSDDDSFGPSSSVLNGTSTRGGRGRGRGRGRGSRGSRSASTTSTRGSRSSSSSNKTQLDNSTSNISSYIRKSNRSTSKNTNLTRDGSDDQDSDESFGARNYKPSPKKKMKFTYVSDD